MDAIGWMFLAGSIDFSVCDICELQPVPIDMNVVMAPTLLQGFMPSESALAQNTTPAAQNTPPTAMHRMLRPFWALGAHVYIRQTVCQSACQIGQ